MKTKYSFLTILLTLILLFTGCTQLAGDTSKEEGKLQVYASIYPVAYFAQKIGGEQVQVIQLVPTGVEPHDFEPKAKDLARMYHADLFLYNGIGMEGWIERLQSTLTKDTLVVNTSEGIELLPWTGKSDHEHNSSHKGEMDPHIWLDPMRAKQQAARIRDALIEVDPEHQNQYEENYDQLAQELDDLDKQIAEVVRKGKRKEFIVSHGAFGYLADRYGLKQIAVSGLTPSAEPSAQELKELIQLAKDQKIDVILFEPLVSGKVAEVVRKEVGAQARELNPIEGLTAEDVKNNEDYFSLMKKNIESLKWALEAM